MFFGITVLMILSLGATGEKCTIGTHWQTNDEFLVGIDNLKCTISGMFDCDDPFECASKTVTREMWAVASYPEPDNITRLDQYPECMADSQCVTYTLWKYSLSIRDKECDDNIFNHVDRMSKMLAKGFVCNDEDMIQPNDIERYNVCAELKGIDTITMESIMAQSNKRVFSFGFGFGFDFGFGLGGHLGFSSTGINASGSVGSSGAGMNAGGNIGSSGTDINRVASENIGSSDFDINAGGYICSSGTGINKVGSGNINSSDFGINAGGNICSTGTDINRVASGNIVSSGLGINAAGKANIGSSTGADFGIGGKIGK